ncbi:glutamate receptor ionotropic kainate 3 [Echinococcus multilocularis]|uniref:Glutamate receptor ionotropic kainate 3 n=1 Tax=Echinococcus multilocularis TaxID=6211 RepID=A0A068YEY4_ECHMU|nr:glutamate receptor ionotropic kainate 3 [Echinococcus multilocularis]
MSATLLAMLLGGHQVAALTHAFVGVIRAKLLLHYRKMPHVLWIVLLLVPVIRAEAGNLLYLTFNENVNSTVTQKFFDEIYKSESDSRLPKNVTFANLHISESPAESPSGIFGAKGYFTGLRTFSTTPFKSCHANDVYVASLSINPAELLAACIKLLERMRDETQASATEKTVIAIPKYMTVIENPFVLLPFISVAQELRTKMLIFWYQDVNDAGILTTKINEANANNVLLLLQSAHLNSVLESAFEKNLFTWNRRWVMMSFDGALPALPRGQEVRNANISVVHVGNTINLSAGTLDTLEDKLAHDTAYVAKAYIDIVCNKSVQVKAVTIKGTTGDFNMTNLNSPRETVILTITRGLISPPEVVGNISITQSGITINGSFNEIFTFSDSAMKEILTSRSIRLAVVLTPPFAMLDKKAIQPSRTPSPCDITQLSGLSVDIVREILTPLGVTYQCTCYPSSLRDDSLQSVYNGLADMAVGEFAVVPQLRDNFDFISNFLYFTFSILEKPLTSTETTSLWLFFKPLSAGTWVMVVFCCFVVALVLATLNYFSPNQVDYGFIESIFVTFGCLFQGLTISPPNTWSSRFMQCVWWLFVLFFIVIYIANYAAIIMSNGIQSEATGFTALLVDPSTPFGAIPNSMAAAQLDFSQELEIQKVNYLSTKLYPQDDTSGITIEDRVKEVSEGKYRLIGDSFSLEYFASNYCLVVSGEFSSQQYAIILKRGTVYTTFLNNILTNLTNKGNIKAIIDKYITPPGTSSCKVPIKQQSIDEGVRHVITLTEVGGIFILMLIGIAVAIILSIIECLFTQKLIPLADRMVRSETRARLRNFF